VQQQADHEYVGYRLDAQGRPSFEYEVEGMDVTDQLRVEGTGQRLERTLEWSGTSSADSVYVRLLRAEVLHRAGPDRFVVGDRAFYLELQEGAESAFVRRRDGGRELLVPLTTDDATGRLRYELIW
jgi:hypothetical protein